MKKYINLLLVITPIILLFALTASLGIMRSNLPEVTVRITGYDPRDLLSGHYISYAIDWENTNCAQFNKNTCPEYEFYNISTGGIEIGDSWGSGYRFYIPEKNARELDLLFRNNNKDVFEVVYSYADGFLPLAKQLLINGKDWREALKKEDQNNN